MAPANPVAASPKSQADATCNGYTVSGLQTRRPHPPIPLSPDSVLPWRWPRNGAPITSEALSSLFNQVADALLDAE